MNNLCRAHPISQLFCAVKEPLKWCWWNLLKEEWSKKCRRKCFEREKSFFFFFPPKRTHEKKRKSGKSVLGWKNNCCFPSFKTFFTVYFLDFISPRGVSNNFFLSRMFWGANKENLPKSFIFFLLLWIILIIILLQKP